MFAHSFGSATDLAIDLGTANTCVYSPGRGIVVNEPSVVAFNTVSSQVEAVGAAAKEMLGRTPAHLVAIKPLREGVIADFEAAEKMLAYFVRKASNSSGWFRPRVLIGVPAGITAIERRAVQESAYRARAREVHLIDEAMAAAVGTGLPVTEPTGSMVVDIGGGTTDIAVISMGGIVHTRSVRVAGNEMDDAIVAYMKKRHGLLIGERTAERIKIEVGSAAPLPRQLTYEVKGRNLSSGIPSAVVVDDQEIRVALRGIVEIIVKTVREGLESIPPELSADICERGIVLTGGGALLKGLDRRLAECTCVPVTVAADPMSSVVLGVGKMLDDPGLMKRLSAA